MSTSPTALLFLFLCDLIQSESNEIISKISFTEYLNLNAINCSLCSIELQILQANQIIDRYEITNSDLRFPANRNHSDGYFTVKIKFLSENKIRFKIYFKKITDNCLFRVIRRNENLESESDRFIEQFYPTTNATIKLLVDVRNQTDNNSQFILPNSIVSINCSTTSIPLLIVRGIHRNRMINITKDSKYRFLYGEFLAQLSDHNKSLSCEIFDRSEIHRKIIKIIHPPKAASFDMKYLNFVKPKYSLYCLKDVGYPAANIQWDYNNNSQSLFSLKGNKISVRSTAKNGSMIQLVCKARYKSPIEQSVKSFSTKFKFLIQNSNRQKEQSTNYVIIFVIMIAIMGALIGGSIWLLVSLCRENSPTTKHEENEEPLIYEAPCNLIRPNALEENNSIFSDRSNSFPLEIQRTNSQYHRSVVNNIK